MFNAVIFGLMAGIYLARRHTRHILLTCLLYRYKNEQKYQELYEMSDTDTSYEMSNGLTNSYKSYKEFLLRHEAARPFAVDVFRECWQAVISVLRERYFTVLVIAVLLFRQNVVYFLLAFMFVHMFHLAHDYFYKDNKIDYFATLMHNMVLSNSIIDQQTSPEKP